MYQPDGMIATPDYKGIFPLLPPMFDDRPFPVHPSTKVPAVAHWQRPRRRGGGWRRKQTEYQLRFPDYAMGLRLGEGLCGELAVIDVDHPEELTDHQQGVIEGWPWLVATHRGLHAYGRPSGQWVKSVKQLPWGDYLAHGSFVVGPGNAHRDGGRYMAMPGWGVGPGLRTPGVRPATVPA